MNHWQTHISPTGTRYALGDSSNNTLKDALETCAAKAISLLGENIQDDSLYLLFEWNPDIAELNIAITDASKQIDAPAYVGAHFAVLQQELESLPPAGQVEQKEATSELVKFLLSDYLASCSAFFRYSLVAIFHSSSRADSVLL